MEARSRLTGISNCGISELPNRHISGTLPANYLAAAAIFDPKSLTGFFRPGFCSLVFRFSGVNPQVGRKATFGSVSTTSRGASNSLPPVADLIHLSRFKTVAEFPVGEVLSQIQRVWFAH